MNPSASDKPADHSKLSPFLGLLTLVASALLGAVLPCFLAIIDATIFSFSTSSQTAAVAIFLHYGLIIVQIFILIVYIAKKVTAVQSPVNTWLPLIMFSILHLLLITSSGLLRFGILWALYN